MSATMRRPDPWMRLLDDLTQVQRYSPLYEALDELPPAHRDVMVCRWGLFGQRPLTQQEIADERGITRQRVWQIEKRALDLLFYRLDGRREELT